jgi:hypothetical protein
MAVSIHDPVNIPPAEETTTVVECSQWASLGGMTVDEALAASNVNLDRIVKLTVPAGARCPWGHSWYRENEDGVLELWRSNWDSSG